MTRTLIVALFLLVLLGANLVRSAPTAFAAPFIVVTSPLNVGQTATATGGGFGANSTGFICIVIQSPGVCQPNQLFSVTSDASGAVTYPFTVPNYPGQQTLDINLGGLKASYVYTINSNGTPPPANGNGIINGMSPLVNGNGFTMDIPRKSFLYPGHVAPANFFSIPGAGGMQLIIPVDKNLSRYGPGTQFFPQGYVSQNVVPRPQQWFGNGPGISSANNGGFSQNPWGDPIGACLGLGITQNIDQAALELFLAYRSYGAPACPTNGSAIPFN